MSAEQVPPPDGDLDLRPLYQAVSRGRLERFLTGQSQYVSSVVVASLDSDRRHAIHFGDLDAAALAATAAAHILERLGLRRESLSVHLDLASIQFEMAGVAGEYLLVRDNAQILGARAYRKGWDGELHRAWLLAAQCSWEASRLSQEDDRRDLLLGTLEALTGIAESLARAQIHDHETDERLADLAVLMALTYGATRDERWPETHVLQLETRLRIASRAAERILPRSILTHRRIATRERDTVRDSLLSMFARYADD